MKKKLFKALLVLSVMTLVVGCYPDEELNVPQKEVPLSMDPIDVYIRQNFEQEFGIAVRYKFVDRYVDPTKRVTPPKRSVIIPMLEFLNSYWIEPFLSVPNGEEYFRRNVPAEVIFIGSSIYNEDGTVTLGTADAGARITLTEVNDINIQNREWVLRQLGTIYHEFAHIMHQRFNLPPNYEQISPDGYTSTGSWYNLSDEEALRRGFVSPYGTSTLNEDFAEFVAFLLFEPDFFEIYINDEQNCATAACSLRNEGRAKLRRKYNAITRHYQQYTGIDLLQVRAIIQEKLN